MSRVAMIVITVPADEVDLASGHLWRLGVRAVEERTPADPLGAPSGRVELWTSVGDPVASQRVRADLATRWPTAVVEIDAAPADTWREHAGPMWIGTSLVIVPAWMPHEHGSDPAVTVVPIEPGGAFGLGDHPTTRLCLQHLVSLDDGEIRGRRVLDVGCGTGVLSVVAARRGAERVRAVDVADAAVVATADNARRNGVSERVLADGHPAEAVDGEYDVVLANILAPELIALAVHLRRLTAPGGMLVISGILAGAHGHVLAALHPMVAERTDVLDGWAAVTLRHPDVVADRAPAEQFADRVGTGE